jgi:GNAT superfamily N-acetyltransferase
VLPQYRRRGLSRALFNAAVGIFAESGYPTQQKLWVLTGAPSETALQGARFQVSKDKARFLAEVTHAEHS